MNLVRLALRNTRRHPRRTLLTGLAIGIAVAAATFLDAYMTGLLEGFFETYVRLEAGHVKVMPREAIGRSRPLPLDKGIMELNTLLETVGSVPGVQTVSPRIRFGVLLDRPGGGVPAFGIAMIPGRESGLIELDALIVEGHAPADSGWEVALGIELAEELGLGVGDELFMVTTDAYGGLGPGLYRVVGLTCTGVSSFDRKNFYIPLSAAQEQLAMEDAAMELVCRVEGGMDAAVEAADRMNDALTRAGRHDVAAVPWQKQGYLYRIMAPARLVGVIVMFLLGVIALTTVINTILMSVMERTREIGALRALGFERKMVVRLILGESLAIGIFSTLAGIALGIGVASILQKTGIDYSSVMSSFDMPISPIIYPEPSVLTALKAGLLGMIVSIVAAWYPARVAVRKEPAEALRME